MFSSVFDDDASKAKLWSDFSWETGCSDNPATTLEYVINHVFCPVHYRPNKDDYTEKNAYALAQAVYVAARAYNEYIDEDQKPYWSRITNMLQHLCVIVDPSQRWNREKPLRAFMQSDELYLEPVITLLGMKPGDILVFPASYRDNTYGVIFRQQDSYTLCELLYPYKHSVEDCGQSKSAYPGLVVTIPNQEFNDRNFRSHLASLLLCWVPEPLIATLCRSGQCVEPECITKCTRPSSTYINADGSFNWCRSHLWFLIKLAIQSSLKLHPLCHQLYKTFLLSFMSNLANYASNTDLAGILLHSMSAKILRRFRKCFSSQWLCDVVLHACTSLSEALDRRRKEVVTQSRPERWDLSQLNLSEDIYASLPHIQKFISSSSASRGRDFSLTPFAPNCHSRGTLIDFLFDPVIFLPHSEEASHHGDTHVALYDAERAVEEELDDWVSRAEIEIPDEACEQLERLVYQYQMVAWETYSSKECAYDPDHLSTMLLTIIELWVALDKLVVREFPILPDYSPELPIDILSKLILRDESSIHRLRRAYQYISARHNQAHMGWSLFSEEFTEDSFPCRYYDSSLDLQRLRALLQDVLPLDPVHAKIIVFELQCPMSLDVWRCVTSFIFHGKLNIKQDGKDLSVKDIPALKPHINSRCSPISLYSSLSQRHHRLYYIYQGTSADHFESIYKLPSGPYTNSGLQLYLESTIHTSNEVLANQADRNLNLSSHEFLAFAHLRSGGSLQWFNILRELRSRTLDFRHHEIYLLFAQASSQVGPLDNHSTGDLLWYQELQNASFCHVLLEELESLFTDVGAGSSDGQAMAVISLLAASLASKPSQEISERAIKLLRNVRRKTLHWVRELLYNSRMSPANEESLVFLRDMATVCRSTFDVGPTAVRKLLHSSQDIEAALSCAMIIYTIVLPTSDVQYSHVLLSRDRRLALVLEECLRDAIQADTTDLGVDHAVSLLWPGYRPSPRRWESLPSPNSRWLACETAPTGNRRAQMVHINLLDGSFLVDGKPSGHLPSDVMNHSAYRELFGTHDLMVVPSDRPGMDFVTVAAIYKHHVHFAVRSVRHKSGSRLKVVVIRAENTDGYMFELIPREELQGGLPILLVEGHVHWLNLSTSVIEIRPIDKVWEQSSNNWTIHFQTGRFRVTKGREVLVGNHSTTWNIVSNPIRCIEYPENLIITMSPVDITQSPSSLQLSITLPRYGLSFFINEDGDLQSCDYKDMVYDEDQCVGTLFGLTGRLVLCHKVQLELDLTPKYILVPHCDQLSQKDNNIHAYIPSSGPVHHFVYQVDSVLGCLKGNATLESRLYLARLHALTSNGCTPDPLTGRTGVEEAISLIWLAGTRQQTKASSLGSQTQSFQIHFALQRLQGLIHPQVEDRDGFLQESRLFPSEVPSSVRLRILHQNDSCQWPFMLLDKLLLKRPPPNLCGRNILYGCKPRFHSPDSIHSLRQLFSTFRTSKTTAPFQSQFISRLHNSAHYFQTTARDPVCDGGRTRSDDGKPGRETLLMHYSRCRINYVESLNSIKIALGPKTRFETILDQCGQWPRVTPFILFRCLATTSRTLLPESWKKCLTALALLALDLQRARRLFLFDLDNSEEEFYQELENEGCNGWDPLEYPDWLLIQLQGNFLIRRVQVDVAREMMFPRSHNNTLMQVNMGEGKTSVIIPICAAALADGVKLVRIIVPKPLIPQTLQVLTDRLCGLVDRPIYYLTFSRGDVKVESAVDRVCHLQTLAILCKGERGIIVTQPEHVLSLKLACVETQLPKEGTLSNPITLSQKWGFKHVLHVLTASLWTSWIKTAFASTMIRRINQCDLGRKLIKTAEDSEPKTDATSLAPYLLKLCWFYETYARDILDESDEVLNSQLQLIYAFGSRRPFEGSPDRWLIIQQVLELAKRHVYLLSSTNSHTLRCHGNSPGSFPHIHILRPEGGEQLVSLIADDVLDGRLPSLSFHTELGLRGAIRDFILRKEFHPETVRMVEQYANQSIIWGSLLLLRGLLAHNILLFALTQRRWRVDYGLDLSPTPRTTLAIPYRAKDVPAEMAEFGHPDTTILLTCLSYYYGGLKEDQLQNSFELLLQQGDPPSVYALWVKDYDTTSMPSDLQTLSGINIRSLEQWAAYLVPLFARNKQAIDMYLSKVVFAKHAKEFPHRISASYWDIAEKKEEPVTGFSGTNDGQYLLPTSIVQYDPDYLHQTGTNARVLAYLLQPENSSYMVTTDENGERWTTLNLLKMVVAQNPPIRVLLDIGAQILDFSNLQLAKAWLDCTIATETAGAVYFNEDDKLMVLTRNGTTQSLLSSPLLQQLHQCVTYLDHVHTRGTDLKFPDRFRAAVTLGHKVTKDRLVQGCMRLRKLGNGHSVMFFAPLEVDQRIRGLVSKENRDVPVTTADILHWAIHETWSDLQRQVPFWAQQGISHRARFKAWSDFHPNDGTTHKELAAAWVQTELKSLSDMYSPSHWHSPDSMDLPPQIRDICTNFGVLSLPAIRMDEEQEREISRETEREREEDKRPPRASPAAHSLHPDIVQFVRTGFIPLRFKGKSKSAFRPIFANPTQTTNTAVSASPSKSNAWSPYILATADFCRTIEDEDSPEAQGRENDYLRPVQWVLSAKLRGKDALILVSPFEADQLMPEIKTSKHVHLHLYIPRTTERMKPSDDLRLYAVPPLPPGRRPPRTLIDQLNVFAGQLYLSDYASYVRLCAFLGVQPEDTTQKTGTVPVPRTRSWFHNTDSNADPQKEIINRFRGTRVPEVMSLLASRRGTGFATTHMGKILQGWPLSEEDFGTPLGLDPVESPIIGPGGLNTLVDGGDDQIHSTRKRRVSDSGAANFDFESKRSRLD